AISRARCLFGQQRPRLRFVLAQCDATGLPCEQASAIVSWEVLHLVRNRRAVVCEARRLLQRHGGIFFSAYVPRLEYEHSPRLVADWRPLLEGEGFLVERVLD